MIQLETMYHQIQTHVLKKLHQLDIPSQVYKNSDQIALQHNEIDSEEVSINLEENSWLQQHDTNHKNLYAPDTSTTINQQLFPHIEQY